MADSQGFHSLHSPKGSASSASLIGGEAIPMTRLDGGPRHLHITEASRRYLQVKESHRSLRPKSDELPGVRAHTGPTEDKAIDALLAAHRTGG